MIFELATPFRGGTHAAIEEFALNLQRGYAIIRGNMGTADASGTSLDPAAPQWPFSAVVQDASFTQFMDEHTVATGLAAALAAHIDQRGLWI